MIQRGGEVGIRMLANVQQTTIKPLIQATISLGICMYTDEYDIYSRSVTAVVNMLGMTMAMAFTKCM
jgi:hypothetical protein